MSPSAETPKILLANVGVPGSQTLETYRRRGGYRALERALRELGPDRVAQMVKESGLRGRGGAGFPAALKWSFVPRNTGQPIYLCVNADESEPGTFKDRVLMEHDPHLCLEGAMIAAYAVGCHLAFIYIRGEFHEQARTLQQAINEARAAGYLGRGICGSDFELDIILHRGAGAYICGEETGLLESLEGKKGWPRTKPPFPAAVGLFRCPTVINNVETLANLPWIVLNGPEAFRAIGTEKSTGTKLFCLSGHINRPGVVELPLGTTLREIIEVHGGGVPGGHRVKGVIPGGVSAPVLRAEELEIRADFDAMMAAGTMLGSGAMIVMDETVCMVNAALNIIHFFDHESCGQCTPCREGTAWLHAIIDRVEHGRGTAEDIPLILDICANITGRTICPFGDAAALPIAALVRKFREEWEEHVRRGGCPLGGRAREAVAGHA